MIRLVRVLSLLLRTESVDYQGMDERVVEFAMYFLGSRATDHQPSGAIHIQKDRYPVYFDAKTLLQIRYTLVVQSIQHLPYYIPDFQC